MNTIIRRTAWAAALLLAAAGAFAQGAAGSSAKRYSIADHGAVGDGKTTGTAAIQATIDLCAKDGGGTVVVPKGTFLTGAIFFKPGVNLEVEKDGVLKGSTKLTDYKFVQTRWEGEERIWISALINAFDLQGFKMSGEGTIDGSGDVWSAGRGGGRGGARGARGARGNRGGARGAAAGNRGTTSTRGLASAPPANRELPGLGPKGGLPPTPAGQVSPADDFRVPNLPGFGRPRLVAIQNCTDPTIENLHFKNEASWCLFAVYSKNVTIRNVDIRAEHYIPSSDGIDIDSCDGVMIDGVSIDCNDDCIAIKSGKDEDGRRVNRPCENVVVQNSTFLYGHGGVSMGSEVSGGIRNVEIRDCVMKADNWAPIRFKSQPSRGGVVENIVYRNIKLENTRSLFEFNMEWRMVNPKPAVDPLTTVRNVQVINVSGTTGSVGAIHGLQGSPIRDLVFKDCTIAAQRGMTIDNAENVDLSGLHITVPEGVEPIVRRGAGDAAAGAADDSAN